jgi:hypothetical protein
MHETSAARLAALLRAAKKAQTLRGADIADRVEGLTGERPTETQVSRWLTGRKPLLAVSDDLFVIAAALELDPMDLIEDAIRNPMPEREPARRGVTEAS